MAWYRYSVADFQMTDQPPQSDITATDCNMGACVSGRIKSETKEDQRCRSQSEPYFRIVDKNGDDYVNISSSSPCQAVCTTCHNQHSHSRDEYEMGSNQHSNSRDEQAMGLNRMNSGSPNQVVNDSHIYASRQNRPALDTSINVRQPQHQAVQGSTTCKTRNQSEHGIYDYVQKQNQTDLERRAKSLPKLKQYSGGDAPVKPRKIHDKDDKEAYIRIHTHQFLTFQKLENELGGKIRSLYQENSDVEEFLRNALAANADYDKGMKNLQQQLRETENKRDHYLNENDRLREKLQQATLQIDDLGKEYEAERKYAEKTHADYVFWHDRAQDLAQKLQCETQRAIDAAKKLNREEGKTKDLTGKLEQKHKQLVAAKQEQDRLQQELETLNHEMHVLEQQKEDQDQQIEEFHADEDRHLKEIASLAQENNHLQHAMKNSKMENEDLLSIKTRQEREVQKLQDQVRELEKKLRDFKQENARLW